MKLAICLYGHIRSFDRAIDSWKSFYDTFDPDIYVHTWSTIDDRSNISITPDRFESKLGSRLKSIVIDDYSQFEPRFKDELEWVAEYQRQSPSAHHGIELIRRYSQTYKVECADKLRRESGIDYDGVILTRPDVSLNPWTEFTIPSDNEVAIAIQYEAQRCVWDLIRYGSSDVMTRVSGMYTAHGDIVRAGMANNDPHVCFDIHGMLYSYIVDHLKLSMVVPDLSVSIVRGS